MPKRIRSARINFGEALVVATGLAPSRKDAKPAQTLFSSNLVILLQVAFPVPTLKYTVKTRLIKNKATGGKSVGTPKNNRLIGSPKNHRLD